MLDKFDIGVDRTSDFSWDDIQGNRIMATLSYFGILWLIPFFARRNSPFVKFHLNQGILISILALLLPFLNILLEKVPVMGSFIYVVLAFVAAGFLLLGAANAAFGRARALPVFGRVKIIK